VPLLICRTCPRDEPGSGSFGLALDAAVADRADGVRVRHVPCLGGCPHAGNVALDGPGKPRVRFSRITPDDADVVLDAARRYDASADGAPGDWEVPSALAERLTATTPKR
jgi:predicted metal-binding protein